MMPHKDLEKRREYRRSRRAADAAYAKRWFAARPEYGRAHQLRRKYSLSTTDWEQLWFEQDGFCALCQRPLIRGKNTTVDHDHETGKVRGLLHNQCNVAIGLLGHDRMRVRLAGTYLDKHTPVDGVCVGESVI